jgi:hypothetical protein
MAHARAETLQPLQEPEFLFPLSALVLELPEPLPQPLVVFRTPPPALLEFGQVDRAHLVGIDEAWHFALHRLDLALDARPFPLLTALHGRISMALFLPRPQ